MARITAPVPPSRKAATSGLRYIGTAPDDQTLVKTTPSPRRKVGWEYLSQALCTSVPLVAFDLAALVVSIIIAQQLAFMVGGATGDISAIFPPIALGFLLFGAELGLYPGIQLSPVEEFRRLIVAATCMYAIWTISLLMILNERFAHQWTFLVFAFGLSAAFLVLGRSISRRVLGKFSWWGYPTLVCGDDTQAVEVYDWLRDSPHVGLRPAGVIADPTQLELDDQEPWFLGNWSSVAEAAIKNRCYWALVVPSREPSMAVTNEVESCLATMPHVQLISELTGLPDHWGGRRPVDGLDGIHIQQNLLLPGKRFIKRIIDLVLSVSAVILLAPLLVAIGLAVKLTSRGPVFFGHKRLGYDGQEFKAWKFRTMVADADKALEMHLEANPEAREEWDRDHKLKWDPRITLLGRVFRKLSLDELPQLWNVVCGDMSLVGPRPIVTKEIEKYGDCYGLYASVKPGITGLWQVSGRNNTTYEERVQLDEYYVRNWSPWLDAYLLLRTVKTVLFTEGAY